MDNNIPSKTPFEDIRREAIRHYDEISIKATHYNSFIPKALEAYQEWVSVDDELPEFGKRVLVWFIPTHPIMEGKTIGIDYRREWEHLPRSSFRNTIADRKGFAVGEVTHWQLLPSPPTKLL